MSKVTESIYDGEHEIIPLAKVSFIEKSKSGIQVIMESSQYNREYNDDSYDKAIHFSGDEKDRFLQAWTRHRYEVEGGKEVFANPED